jgi:hypothetical protein
MKELRILEIIGKPVKVKCPDGEIRYGVITGRELDYPIVTLGLGWDITISPELAARAIYNNAMVII